MSRGGVARLRRAIAVLCVVGLACAVNPVTGEREIVLMSASQEAALGRQGAEQVEAEMGLVDDPALAGYVSAIGARLAAHSPRHDVSYRFAVAGMAEPNAFALPGGYIYVSRGLLAIANSEAELANVIGHEIGHVAARHAAQRQTRQAGAGLATLGAVLLGAALGGDAGAQLGGQMAQVAGAGLIASYSRDQERQADQVGQGIAAAAGYDPAAMASFLSTLEREARLRSDGEARRPGFLDSHPMTGERVAATAARARSIGYAPAPPVAAGGPDFLARLEGLLVGPDPAEGVIRDRRFLHPGLGIALAFPRGWDVQNGRSAVAARSPDGDALLVLQAQGPAGDPRSAAQAFAKAQGLVLESGEPVRIGGFAGWHALAAASTAEGDLVLDLTWIAHPRLTLRLLGLAPAARYRARAGELAAARASFRRLADEERASIAELRLRIATAREGERIPGLSARTGNAWSSAETAVANALAEDAPLRAGQRVKIAVRVPFRR